MQIRVEGNLDVALRSLKRGLEKDRIFVEIKLREAYPNRSDRKKAKVRIAATRRHNAEKKKAAMDSRRERRRSDYDYIRRQDQQNRQFILRRSLEGDPAGRNQDGKVSQHVEMAQT